MNFPSPSSERVAQAEPGGPDFHPSVTYGFHARGGWILSAFKTTGGVRMLAMLSHCQSGQHAWCLEVVGRNLLGKGNSKCIVCKKELIS